MKPKPEKHGYLIQVLRMNPVEDADALIHVRSTFLGLSSADGKAGDDWAEAREERNVLADRIDALRERFWSLDAESFLAQADELSLDRFPDLKAALDRLRRVSKHRGEFAALAEDRRVAAEFLKALQHIVTAPSREAAKSKASLLALMNQPKDFLLFRRSAKRLKRKNPQLFALEADWLGEILQFRRPPGFLARTARFFWDGVVFWVYFYLVILILAVIIWILTVVF